jgi:hypothetical protein
MHTTSTVPWSDGTRCIEGPPRGARRADVTCFPLLQ